MRRTTNAPLGVIAVSLVAIAVNFPGDGRGAHAQDPSQVGQWEWENLTSPVPATNEFVLPTGLVVLVALGGQQNWGTLWDPLDGNYTYKPAPRQTNCSGFCQLPDGRILVAGGGPIKTEVSIFDPFTENGGSWTSAAPLANPLFYPTCTPLPDGRVLVTGGENNIPEIYDPNTGTWESLNAGPVSMRYPRMFVLPSGLVFSAGSQSGMTHTFDVANDSWEEVGNCGPICVYPSGNKRPVVALEPGKILSSGGGSAAAMIIDFNVDPAETPSWEPTTSMNLSRNNHNATLLPDGTVLVTGGVLAAELFNPGDKTWTVMASMHYARSDHSTAPLLPDGRVASREEDSSNPQIFSPPYLFKGARPTIVTGPDSIGYGRSFEVETDSNSIGSVALLRPSATTHLNDMGQLYIPLAFTPSGGTLAVSAPANANLAPPGYYMLFIVNQIGVPSIAHFVQVAASAPCPWDLGGNGNVDVPDLLALLAAWGSNPGGPPDFDGNGMVAVPDLLALLSAWGPCP
ncbi:MAG: DUF1929 domain-containing protein [Gemmatimonadetes bacterium]|nr:DUF1929 domain-containing protein [Gemmatimonadota bacterium]